MNRAIPTDALVTAEDVVRIKNDINRGELKRLVYEMTLREPELAVLIAEKHDFVLSIVQGASMSIQQRVVLTKHLSLLIWTPLLLLHRAQRRIWQDFLPSEDVVDLGEKGGAE